MVSAVSVKITWKSPTRKRFASTPTHGFTLLACDDALSAYCLILARINFARCECHSESDSNGMERTRNKRERNHDRIAYGGLLDFDKQLPDDFGRGDDGIAQFECRKCLLPQSVVWF